MKLLKKQLYIILLFLFSLCITSCKNDRDYTDTCFNLNIKFDLVNMVDCFSGEEYDEAYSAKSGFLKLGKNTNIDFINSVISIELLFWYKDDVNIEEIIKDATCLKYKLIELRGEGFSDWGRLTYYDYDEIDGKGTKDEPLVFNLNYPFSICNLNYSYNDFRIGLTLYDYIGDDSYHRVADLAVYQLYIYNESFLSKTDIINVKKNDEATIKFFENRPN